MTAASRLAGVLVHLLLALGLGAGCGAKMLPPARSSGATLSDDGISVAVVGQTCGAPGPAGAPAPPSIEMTLAIEVGNPTPEPVGVHPERMVLLAPGPITPRFLKREDSQPVAVTGGTTAPFTLQFVVLGISCSQEMRLDSSAALEWDGQRVALSPVRFTPVGPPP